MSSEPTRASQISGLSSASGAGTDGSTLEILSVSGSSRPRRALKTAYDLKPVPSRQWDWTATLADYDAGDAVGYGATESEAIADLQAQLDEEELAPLTVPEDEERDDGRSERARLMDELGLRERDFR